VKKERRTKDQVEERKEKEEKLKMKTFFPMHEIFIEE